MGSHHTVCPCFHCLSCAQPRKTARQRPQLKRVHCDFGHHLPHIHDTRLHGTQDDTSLRIRGSARDSSPSVDTP